MRRGTGTTIGFAIAAMGASLVAAPSAQAGCTRSIINKSAFTAVVRRDGGPGVAVPPHSAQPIQYYQPGRIEVALYCGRPDGGPERAVWAGSFSYSAIIDRCYFEIGDGFFEDQLGPGFIGTRDSKPLTLNMPRQGDFVIGPIVEDRCAAVLSESVRARY